MRRVQAVPDSASACVRAGALLRGLVLHCRQPGGFSAVCALWPLLLSAHHC